ncbi:MAG: hypothetical protein WCF67_12990 [Chitinophagaceae bacterium]
MKRIYAFAAIALLLGLSSCLSTVHPIFTEKDLVFDPKLIGKWRYESKSFNGFVEITQTKQQDFTDYPTLGKLAGKTYMLRYKNTEGGIDAAYYGFMVKLGNKYYIDQYPAETPATMNYDPFYKGHYLKMHTCYLLSFKKDNSFELKQFDETYLKKLINDKKIRVRHETREDGSLIVTASTEELQQYIMKYSDVPEAYYQDNTSTYTRIINY